MKTSYQLSDEGRRMLIMKKAHNFACFYRDIRKAFRSRRLMLHGAVSVSRSGMYAIHRDGPFAFISTPPALAPGSKRKLYVRLR
ncbi:hypothetical protein [Pantoea phage Nafs113]|nr:hypothetical protein [Pantoea phage Nafs113]